MMDQPVKNDSNLPHQLPEISPLLLNAIPGGVAVFSVEPNETPKLLYINDEICNLSGFARDEIETGNPLDVCRAIREDSSKALEAIKEAASSRKRVNTVYRSLTKTGQLKYIQLSVSIAAQADQSVRIYAVYNDVTEQQEHRALLRRQDEEIHRLADIVPGGIFRCKRTPGWEILEANEGFYRFLGYSKAEFFGKFQNRFSDVIHPDDLPYISVTMEQSLSTGNHVHTQNRMICKNGDVKWIDIQAERAADETGEDCLCCIFLDITERAKMKQELRLYRTSNLVGVFSMLTDQDFTLLYGNDKYYRIHEYTKQSMADKLHNHCLDHVSPDDRARVKKTVQDALDSGKDYVQWDMRILTGKQKTRYVLCNGVFQKEGGRLVMNGTVMDITTQKETEAALRDWEEKLRIATENADISFWTYDHQKQQIITTAVSKKLHNDVGRIDNAPESLIAAGYVHRDSAETLRALHAKLHAGARTASGDLWFRTKDENGWWCEHVDYTNFFDGSGKPVYAQGIGRDVTAIKNAEKKYQEETDYARATQSEKLLDKVRSDLTRNVVEDYVAKQGGAVLEEGISCAKSAELLAQTALTPEEQEQMRTFLNRKRILHAFSSGDTACSMTYRRRMQDAIIWAQTTIKCYKNPENGHVMSFLYTYDIDEEKIRESIIEEVTCLEYDYIAYVDLKSDRSRLYMSHDGFRQMLSDENESYRQSVYRVNRVSVVPEDMERAIAEMLPDGIRKNLRDQKVFSTVYAVYDSNRNIRQKRLQFAYLDEIAEKVIITRTDITDIMARQKQQQQTLEAALLAAEQANSAKSGFLSRMSHEIRTPMNAIIGMSAIAAQSIGDDEQVADCIGKIGISSRFLLSLINDILDMSRIESGKMLLKAEKIPFEEFVSGVNSICYTQAKAKCIDYECIVDPNVEDYYVGDAMKLQQIIINILSNAVKFTPERGRVTLHICQTKKSKGNAVLRFVINDTGRGISEEYIPHLFEAFSQENAGTTTQYGGTGLGLTICKNLVDMMNGRIGVRSIVGVGTEFTVDVTLGITEESKTRYLNKTYTNFSKLKALIVDDDTTVCEHAVITLKEMSVESQWVDSGEKAVERVKENWARQQFYDLVLVDWKMPGMDGIETARRIRQIVGPDVTIIIMTAYDWASIEHEAKRAGVNLLMNKPMFKSNLISAFEKVLGKQEEQSTVIAKDFRFDGKRVLLAEDHPLNVEVAKKLLESRGFAVEHADNGLKALEMFTTSPTGYYDAILMDIRMPQMDGLQAANAIRHLSKPTAKTIPIIAMTANAFEEDIQKSKAVGMDAHLAKPIDPNQMYQTLYDFIYGGGTCEKL